MQLFIVFVVGLCVAFGTSHFAERRGRNANVWFWIGLLLGVIALIILFLLPAVEKTPAQAQATANPSNSATGWISTSVQSSINPSAPIAKPDCRQQQWFYADSEHQQQGPVDFRYLSTLWADKRIVAQTYVWTEGMVTWQTIHEVPLLLDALSQ